ncbi:MAG TPA: cation diffusion facilitator family transporter [Bryobacteraceae bacterium]|nr:cation diffusion facilitator family transporter [Bryobacteraceae bacterium]
MLHSHRKTRVLFASLLLTLAFVAIEAVAGFRAHSLALLSDAGHNFTDAFALLLAAGGVYWEARPGDHVKTYGYQRAGVLAAFVNALTLAALALVLFYESYRRLMRPEPVGEMTMIVIASIALVLNVGIARALGGHGDHRHDLNVRAAWIHMVGDAASCVAIIVGAVVMRYTGWHAIDPLLSILIGAGIVWTAWGIVRDSLNILLEGLPKGLKLRDVSRELGTVGGVIDVHDLHIWNLGSESRALSCHVLIEDMPPSSSDAILKSINQILCDRFEIRHTTVQFEHVRCELAHEHCTAPLHADGKPGHGNGPG